MDKRQQGIWNLRGALCFLTLRLTQTEQSRLHFYGTNGTRSSVFFHLGNAGKEVQEVLSNMPQAAKKDTF